MNKTILVVDYEQKSLDEIQQFFEDEHFTLLTAYDGNQALEIFEARNPDLVITSALLPKLNGFELCKKITSGEHGEIRPVIMFSGIYKAEKYRKEAIIGCGAVDFLEKPIAKWQMLKVIKSLFSEIPCEQPARRFKTSEAAATSSEVGLTSASQEFTADDPLQVEPLLEGNHNRGLEKNAIYKADSSVLNPDLEEVKLLSPQEEDELGAAVDAVRIDLDLGTKLDDQQIARAIAGELSRDGQNVLEFEATTRLESLSSKVWDGGPEIIELDSDAPNPASKPGTGKVEAHPLSIVGGTKGETGGTAAPTFAVGSPRSRNWIPFLIILAGLLMGFLFWLQGK